MVVAAERTIICVFKRLCPIFGWCANASDPHAFLRLPCDAVAEVTNMDDSKLARLSRDDQAVVRGAQAELKALHSNLGCTWLMSKELPIAVMLARAGPQCTVGTEQVRRLQKQVR